MGITDKRKPWYLAIFIKAIVKQTGHRSERFLLVGAIGDNGDFCTYRGREKQYRHNAFAIGLFAQAINFNGRLKLSGTLYQFGRGTGV